MSTSGYLGITVFDDTVGTYVSVPIVANALAPVVPSFASVSPTSLTLPTRDTGSVSIPQTITLANGGPGPLALSGFVLTGTSASEFSQTNNRGNSLAANATCTLNVTFAPTSAGAKSAVLTLNGARNSGLPLAIPLSRTAQ